MKKSSTITLDEIRSELESIRDLISWLNLSYDFILGQATLTTIK
jgi:hypothetical protein